MNLIRRLALFAVLAFSLLGSAHALTTAQLATLKAAILADPVLAAQPMTSAGSNVIADAMNLAASPTWTVWKTNVSINAIGDKINGTELAGLSSLNTTRLQMVVMLSPSGVNPSLADRRQFFDDIFSGAGGTNTRAALLILWKRTATRVEKLFSTGTGSDAAPATLTFEGVLSSADVQLARES